MAEPFIDAATFDELRATVGDDFIGELIEAFLEEAPALFRTLLGARAAGDVEGVRRAAHSLKSISASVGALPLSRLAREVEVAARDGGIAEVGSVVAAIDRAVAATEHELREHAGGARD